MPNVTAIVTVNGVSNPTSVALGQAVEVAFVQKSALGSFYIDSCTAKGFKKQLALVENSCVSTDSAVNHVRPVIIGDGTKLQFNQFAFTAGIFTATSSNIQS